MDRRISVCGEMMMAILVLCVCVSCTLDAQELAPTKNMASCVDSRLTLFAHFEKDAKIRVDGVIDEEVWAAVPWTGGFLHYKTYEPARHPTAFKVVRSDEGVYFAIKAEGGQPAASAKEDGTGAIFEDDVVEIFVGTEFGSPDYRQFVFNALGTRYTGSGPEAVSEYLWNVKARPDSKGYIAEVFIPYATAGIAVKDAVLGFNVCRDSQINGVREVSSWSGVQHSFHYYHKFGRLVFGPGGGDPIPLPVITADNDKRELVISYKAHGKGVLYGWINYSRGRGARYGRKAIEVKQGEVKFPFWEDLHGGEHNLTIVRKEDAGITAVLTARFCTYDFRFMKLSYDSPQLNPSLKQAQWRPEPFDIRTIKTLVYYPSESGYEEKTAQKLRRYLGDCGMRIAAPTEGRGAFPRSNAVVLGSLQNPRFLEALSGVDKKVLDDLRAIPVKGEGYVLKLCPNGLAILAGQDGAGAYYAFRTMLQIVRFDPDRVPQASIVDWPDHPVRQVLELPIMRDLGPLDWEFVERYVFEVIAGNRFNELTLKCNRGVFLYEDGDNPKLNSRVLFTKAQFKNFLRMADENFITVIPGLQSAWKADFIFGAYPELREFPDTKLTRRKRLACIRHPKFWKIWLPLVKEIHETFGARPEFMIALDEIHFQPEKGGIYECPYCGETPKWKLLQEYIEKMTKYLQTLGVKEVRIWTDMLLEKWNGGPPLNFAKVRDLLPKDVIVPVHWGGERGARFSDEPLFRSGFKNIIWCSTDEVTWETLPEDVSRYQGIGMNRCGGNLPWIICFPDYRNFQSVVRTGDILWNACRKEGRMSWEDYPYQKGAALMRVTSARPVGSRTVYEPVPLSGRKDLSAAWNLPGKGFNFAAIKRDIETSRFRALYNDGTAVLLMDNLKTAVIPVGGRCRTLAALHTLYIDEGAYGALSKKVTAGQRRDPKSFADGCKVGEYVLEYEDGTRAGNAIRLGYNIFFSQHQNHQDFLLLWDASEVWTVPFEDKPFMASVYVIVNPHPEKEVKCIRFERSEEAVELALFALARSVSK